MMTKLIKLIRIPFLKLQNCLQFILFLPINKNSALTITKKKEEFVINISN